MSGESEPKRSRSTAGPEVYKNFVPVRSGSGLQYEIESDGWMWLRQGRDLILLCRADRDALAALLTQGDSA